MVNVSLNSPKDNVAIKSEQIKKCLDQGQAVILIWAKWCHHCTDMKPEWDRTKETLSKQGVDFVEIESENVQKLDGDLRQRIVKNKALYFPMIRMFNGKRSQEYAGERNYETMSKAFAPKLRKTPSKTSVKSPSTDVKKAKSAKKNEKAT